MSNRLVIISSNHRSFNKQIENRQFYHVDKGQHFLSLFALKRVQSKHANMRLAVAR